MDLLRVSFKLCHSVGEKSPSPPVGRGTSAPLEKHDTRTAGPVFILSEACDLHDRPLALELWMTLIPLPPPPMLGLQV